VDSLRPWYDAGAPAVGMGSKLLKKDLVESRGFDALAEQVALTVAAVSEARS
jgi:2-keto-3-deoxy-6-phosphogluconate aldolase